MAKGRYKIFILETNELNFDNSENFYESRDWRSVFGDYMRLGSATVYGLPNYDGANYEVIMSK